MSVWPSTWREKKDIFRNISIPKLLLADLLEDLFVSVAIQNPFHVMPPSAPIRTNRAAISTRTAAIILDPANDKMDSASVARTKCPNASTFDCAAARAAGSNATCHDRTIYTAG